MHSLCNSLIYEHNKGTRNLRKLSLIWIERDPVVIPEVDVVLRESIRRSSLHEDSTASATIAFDDSDCLDGQDTSTSCRGANRGSNTYQRNSRDTPILGRIVVAPTDELGDVTTNFVTQLLAMVPPSRETDEELARVYPDISDMSFLTNTESESEASTESESPEVEVVRCVASSLLVSNFPPASPPTTAVVVKRRKQRKQAAY
jgi:hypothetical protein